jgi:hypothetical protein
MDYEDYTPHECDHDDDVRCTHTFFHWHTNAHLARRRLVRMLKARTHWVVAVTPECLSYAYRLGGLHQERCGQGMTTLIIRDLDVQPLLCALPRDRVSLDDLIGVIGPMPISPELIESKDWILLTSHNHALNLQAIDRWITTDNLLN